jgi:hypothetical protein
MQVEHVVSILESLGSGVDPHQGTPIPIDSFQSPDVIRALFTAAALLKDRQAAASASHRPAAAGAKWTGDEDALLVRQYDEGLPIPEIARQHDRTTGAITTRLVKLGKIDADAVKTRERGARLVS